ncbi:hypothetical protein [Luteipulveratus flavus]|uniref:hypothetical protein n=1 Tax=Luteipulveratus flavus TaxID=3031728 RepID=UPI00319DFE8B
MVRVRAAGRAAEHRHRKEYEATTKREPDYRVTCIFVDKGYRRRGLSLIALRGAVDLIARNGGGRVEGYPHETPSKRVSSSFLYSGTRSLFEEAGFTFDRPKGTKNCVMVRDVAPAG